ncbi:hypothetical protein HON52_01630 [Candidatus Uhrbacteria bacterium]|jgi:hypothetical protein|nr:hypothetical protein [Candidatus Uhrbacteria bacterium]
MKKSIVFIIGIFVGAVSVFLLFQYIQVNTPFIVGPIQFTCEYSGGVFKGDVCVCPIEEQLGQTQEMMYDESTGYCQTTYGGPGGDASNVLLGFEYFFSIVEYNCNESGGISHTYSRCQCPDGSEYDKDTGYCS